MNAKQKREYKLFTELQNEHGYTLLEPTRGMEKTMLMFNFRTKKTSVAVVMRLSVPADSALGAEMLKRKKQTATNKKSKK